MNIEIRSGRIIDPANERDEVGSLFIADGKVLAIGDAPAGFEPSRVIDASGCVVAPGFIDLCAYLREPGNEHKGTIASETFAAAAGGFSAVCCPPESASVNDTEAVTSLILELANRAGFSKVYPIGALTKGLKGQQLSEMYSLKRAGCVAVSNGGKSVVDLNILKRCFEYAKTHEVKVLVRAEVASLAADGCAHEGSIATRLGLSGIPALAETIAVSQMILLAEATGVNLHFSQLTTAKAVAMVGHAKSQGVAVTCDVAVHHLLLNENAVAGFDSRFHCRPPLRTEADRQALIEGVKSGVVDAICSQHQPHEEAAKQAPFEASSPGISSVETLLPLLLKLVRESQLSLSCVIRSLTKGASESADLAGGSLSAGDAADLCIFDPEQEWVVNDETINSAGKNTPWHGKEMQGKVKYTLVDGRIVYE